MSELKTYKMVDEKYCADCVCVIPSEVYLKSEADKVIAEKDEEIYNIKYSRDEWAKACNQKDKEIAELKAKLENAKATHYADRVDARMRERRLKRALYNLRAVYADMMQKRYIECKTDGWVHRVDKWVKIERKCLNKMEEYK